ncbi:MAG: recombinase RecA, partial [Terriglobales bacterium]
MAGAGAYGERISYEDDLLDLGVEKGFVEKSGAGLSYVGERIGQGRKCAKQFLRENRDVVAKMEAQLRQAPGLTHPAAHPVPAPHGDAANGAARAAAAPE